MSKFENDNDFLAGLKAEFEPAGNKSGNDFLAGLKDEFEPKKPQGGIWETTKAFGRDLAKVPSEISSGFGTTTDQMRMFANFVQGDREELESLYNGLKNYTPLPESETKVGGWVRGAANTLPYMGMSATAGVGGGSIGGALGSVVPYVGTAVGRRAGAALGSASVGFAQGWGEMYGRLRDEGIDHDTAAGIAFAVAPVYAGIEAVQVRKIPGAKQLADKYLGSTFRKILAEKLVDKTLRNKVAKALGSYAGEIISQSAEEGAQEMAMNTGEQYARNDGFKNFDIGENLSAGAEAFKESVGPFAVMQAGNIPINAILNRRAKRLQKDLENVQNAVEEGKGAMKGGVSVPPNTPLGGIFVEGKKFYRNVDGVAVPLKKEEIVKIRANESDTDNLDADAESDPYGKPEDSNTDLDAAKDDAAKLQVPNAPQASASAQNTGERAAQIFMANVQNDPLNVPQGIPPNVDMSLARFVQMQQQLREAQARKAEEEAKRLEADRKAEEAMLDAQAEADFEEAKRKTAEKISKLANKTNRVAARIDKLTDPAARLNAIKAAVDEGNIEKLSDGHLEFAWENGEQWAERELFRRQEAANSGTPLLEVMKENGFKLPTPAAIKRHAQEHGRGLSGYLFGEINDLYNSLPTNQRLKYFTKNYVNLDETAESLKQFGFNYDSEGEFISDVASNLSGQKYSYGFSLAENDYAKMSDAELVEAHRKAEAAKDYSAGFEIKKEWDKRRGYPTDVYHGTGADGFNVAKADASEAKNGEGAQAHGMGLYLATKKRTAERYQIKAPKDRTVKIGDVKLTGREAEVGLDKKTFDFAVDELLKDKEKAVQYFEGYAADYRHHIETIKARKPEFAKKLKFARSDKMREHWQKVLASADESIEKATRLAEQFDEKKRNIQKVAQWIKEQGLSANDIRVSHGELFDWRTNLSKENTLDEQLPFSRQSKEVQEKIRAAMETLPTNRYRPNPSETFKDLVENDWDGETIYDEIVEYTKSKRRATEHLLDHGIKGITYDGQIDGRCYVSFEGGSAVKLQDAFTYGDDGQYIPLDRRSDAGNPDMRYSIGEGDAKRFKNELQDYIDGKLDNRHVFKLGTTPEVMRLVGADNLPVELSASVLERKEAKHSLILENLANLPEELADPIAVMQSSTIPDAITLITELPTIDRHNMLVAVHLNKRFGKAEINSIRSIYPKTQSGLQSAIDRGELRYINTKRKPSWITLPFQHASGRKAIQRAYGHEVFTQADLSQAEKENIFKLRGEDGKHSYSISGKERAKLAKIDGIKTAVEDVRAKFNRRAKVKASVDIVGTLEEALEKLGAESIPYNARAVQFKDRVVIIAENIDNADEAVRIFLHELVGHWGVKKLFGTKADLKPFLNYIISHYQDSDAWKRVAKYYKDVAKSKYAIAEEVLAHVAENRELSDPSMWKRLVHRVKRELWGNGVPQEYVNLLNEDVLRSAIALSREWAKGDHYLNADGIWAKIDSTPKGRDVPDEPDDGKRFSLVGEKGVSRLKNGLARDLLNEAAEMEKSGVDADKIWQETGWERNTVDGKWRFEIPYGFLKRDPRFKSPTKGVNAFEFPAEQTYSPTRKYKLSDIWNAPMLFEAYPELADMPVKFNANPRSLTRGSASKEDGLTINLKDTDLFGNPTWVGASEIQRTIQHEIEHAIQDIEGFSEGATPYTMRKISAFYKNPEGYRRAREEIAAAKKPFTEFCLSLGWDGEGRMPKAFKEKLANDRTLANKYMTLVNAYNTTYNRASKYYTMPSEKFGYEQYRRVGGEVEARNAARRLEMTNDERKAKRPSLTADVEPSSQIYLGDSDIDSLNFHDFKTGEKYNAAETRFSIREEDPVRFSIKEDEAGARAIQKELPNFIQSMVEIKEGLDENWASFVGKEFSADLIKKIVSFNIDKNQPTNLYEYNEKEGNSSRSSQPSPTGEGIVPDRLNGRDIRGGMGSWQQGMGQEASDTLLEEFRRLSRAQERMGEKQKIATRADAIKWIRKNVAQGAFFKNHPNLHIEDLFEYKAGSKFSGSKTVDALFEDSDKYGALSVFDQIRIAAVLQRRELKNEYKPVFGGKESLENDKTGGVFVPKNEKVAESQILAADTIRGCDNDCYDCYANKLSKISTISFTHKVPMTLDNVKIKEGQVIRLGTSGDPASNWTHSRNEMIKLFERAWKGSARVKPQDVSFEKNSFVITKLQSIQGYDPKVFPNLEVSLDPFYPEDMFLAMKNLTVLMAMCPDVNVVARIRSFNSNRPSLNQSLDSALQFCKDHNLRVLETRMRFESKTAYSLLGLVEDDYKNKMSASGEKELAQVVGKVRFLPNFYTEEEKSRLLFCGENGELGCGACQNCVNTQVYNREQSGRNSPIIAQSLGGEENSAYEGITDSDMPMYSLKEGTPETDKEYKQKRAREEIQSKAGRAVQAAVDAFAPLAALERVLYGGVRDAEKSAWKMALMTRNLDQVMFHVLRIGGIKYNKADGSFVKREGTKGLEEILKPVKGENYKNFEHYAKAKSAIERWGFLRKTNSFAGKNFYDTFGFSLEYAKKWVAEGSGASKKAFDELQAFFQGQRDFMLETGLITPEQHAALSRFKNYVPFFREGADLDAETEAAYERFSEIFPAGKGFSGRKSGVEKFEGSARRTKNLVENIVNQSRKVIDSGYKNIAAYRSLNLMRELDMAKYVRSDSVDAQVKIAEMRRALEAEGIEVGDISDEELLKKVPVEAYLKITDDSNDNIVSVRVNGTLRFYKVEDPELLVAVKNFGAEKVNVMWKLLTAPKNIMTQAITKTPEFAIRNFIRDTGSNTILFGGKTLAPYLAHTAKNAVKSAWNTEDMQKVWAAGAGGGAWYSVKAEDIAADFKDGGKIQKIGKYTVKPLKWLLNEYERRILMPSEQGNRITVMQKALENGASDMEAAFQYMDVMNFGMRGSGVWTGKNEWAKGVFTALHAVVRITPFLNARIQGLYKLWRESGAQNAKFKAGEEFGLKERTRSFVQSLSKAVLLRGMMLASASMLYSLYANSSTDDDGDKWFEKLPAHDKLNYWHFYLGNNNILRIPKPFEIGYIFGTIPESITDALIQTRPQTAKVLWAGLTSQLEFDPLSNPVIDTVREQYWNKDSFTKRPIVQQSDKDLKPRYQYDPDTSATAKAVARVFEGVGLDDSWLASPARIQNVIGNFLGGMTKYITAASDVIVESLTDIEGGTSRYARENATKRVYDWAVRNTKTMTTRNAEDYYALRNRVREVYGAARVLRQEKRLEECQNLIDEHKGELGNYDLIDAVNTRLGEISRKRKALGANRTLLTEELIRADDELLAERNKLLADVDILIDRVESGNFNARDMRDILKRIRNADREKKDSKKARSRLRELANMR